MVNLDGHAAGNGGYRQGEPTVLFDSSLLGRILESARGPVAGRFSLELTANVRSLWYRSGFVWRVAPSWRGPLATPPFPGAFEPELIRGGLGPRHCECGIEAATCRAATAIMLFLAGQT
jgi:hypothetical protein